jgi:glycosyltransferase involved in cell wall biosynthesis
MQSKTPPLKKELTIYFTVTTELTYDQRMIRICSSLAAAGFKVVLAGRKIRTAPPPATQNFRQVRLPCFFEKGKLFYAEYNIRLFFYLLFKKMDCICAIDLDTILPCYFISLLKKQTHRVYDAHELFCEMKEIVTRPAIYSAWKKVEAFAVPKFPFGYTVNQPIADEFKRMYGVNYQVIRNISVLRPPSANALPGNFILYQGAVNEGRSFETLLPAMKKVRATLLICGDGNFMDQARQIVRDNDLTEKVIFKGKVPPDELRLLTGQALIGITLFENKGLSNYYSLANRFFDYIHAGIPQLCVDYPVYREINNEFRVAVLVKDLSVENLATQLNNLLDNKVLYSELQDNCKIAREKYNWQQEEKTLVSFYTSLFGSKLQ